MVPVVVLQAVMHFLPPFTYEIYLLLFSFLSWLPPPIHTQQPVYHVGPNGWKKLSGDDVGELHYNYYPVEPSTVEQEMTEVSIAWRTNQS